MAKLYFRYSAMNAGKSTMAIQVDYNYKELGLKTLVWKASIDTKGEDKIVSRVGFERKIDNFLDKKSSPIKLLKSYDCVIDAIIVDEAQFLTVDQVNELYYITKFMEIPVICYGLRCDFQMQGFPGSIRLLSISDEIEEIKNMCKCKHKATQNLRLINGIPTFDGDQVAIDGVGNTTYEAICGKCYIEKYLEYKGMKRERKK